MALSCSDGAVCFYTDCTVLPCYTEHVLSWFVWISLFDQCPVMTGLQELQRFSTVMSSGRLRCQLCLNV
jgi:hypothetical protein